MMVFFVTGYYLYLEASGQQYGDRAQLASPVLQGSCTMRLYYHMMGTHVDSINVYRQMAINGPLYLLSNVSGEAGDNWIIWTIPLPSTIFKPYRLIIEGKENFLIFLITWFLCFYVTAVALC